MKKFSGPEQNQRFNESFCRFLGCLYLNSRSMSNFKTHFKPAFMSFKNHFYAANTKTQRSSESNTSDFPEPVRGFTAEHVEHAPLQALDFKTHFKPTFMPFVFLLQVFRRLKRRLLRCRYGGQGAQGSNNVPCPLASWFQFPRNRLFCPFCPSGP